MEIEIEEALVAMFGLFGTQMPCHPHHLLCQSDYLVVQLMLYFQ